MEVTHTTDVHRVMKVGDTPADIQAGINAGVYTIGVLSGAHDADSLKKAHPNYIIPTIAKLPELLLQEGYL
jgi:phosphoglycolate phosphatase-like HAD superfamily hydrolase